MADGVIADRDALLSAAERLIRRAGARVSLDAIALEAGVTKPVLYRGVGDRDALTHALAERLIKRMSEPVRRRVAQAKSQREALHCLVHGYLEQAAGEKHLYLYVNAGSGEDHVAESLRLADATVDEFARGIAAYRGGESANTELAKTWSFALIGALHYVTLALLRHRAPDIEGAAEHLTELLWRGMAPLSNHRNTKTQRARAKER